MFVSHKVGEITSNRLIGKHKKSYKMKKLILAVLNFFSRTKGIRDRNLVDPKAKMDYGNLDNWGGLPMNVAPGSTVRIKGKHFVAFDDGLFYTERQYLDLVSKRINSENTSRSNSVVWATDVKCKSNCYSSPIDYGYFDDWTEFRNNSRWPRKGDYITVGGVYYVHDNTDWIAKPHSSSKSFTSFAYAIDSLRAEKFASAWGYPKGYENCNVEVSIKENGVQQKVKPFLSEVIATVIYSIKGI